MSENEKETGIAWLKKHADTLVILGAFALAFHNLNEKISSLEKDVAVIKTVLVMKNIMSNELAKCQKEKENAARTSTDH